MNPAKTKAAIITIGDEILVGQTVDTNSAWIASHLNLLGISVREILSISDNTTAITDALDHMLRHYNLIFITGGLGPTQDDITKVTLANYFQDELKMHPATLARIEAYFQAVNRPVLEVHRQQAALPAKAKIIENRLGTASGMWFKKDNASIISLPGVPYEMKGLLEDILPLLKKELVTGDFYHRTILCQGVGETTLAKTISEIERTCLESKISVAYLPSPGIVKIRLSGTRDQAIEIGNHLRQIEKLNPGIVYGYENDTLESVVGDLLRKSKKTIGTAESCTGGALAARFVSVQGSSDYFQGSIISYSERLKQALLLVSEDILQKHGAVSQACVEQMSVQGRKKLGVDYCISISGIAGPTGGTDEKPVGTVWVAISSEEEVVSKLFRFNQNRERNIELTVVSALNFARNFIQKSLSI